MSIANELLVGPGGFPSITSALAAANQFETIRVSPGTYNEVVTKTVQLLGAQAGGTGDRVIDPDGVAEIVPFLRADPLAAPTCDELLTACRANAASLQSQLNACQSALSAGQTIARTLVPSRSLRKIQAKFRAKQRELADHLIRTKKGKKLAIGTLTASCVEVREA